MTESWSASVEQTEIWLATGREPESGRWNIQFDVAFEDPVDVAALRAAIADVAARHPQLTSSFRPIDGVLTQIVPADRTIPLVVHQWPGTLGELDVDAWAGRLGWRPLALESGPMMRADLLAATDGGRLAVTVHHIVADGWSIEVLGRHLIEAYRARLRGVAPELGAAGVPGPAASQADPAAVEHWQRLLAGEWAVLAPLPDLVRDSTAPGPAAHQVAELPDVVRDRLRDLATGEHHLTVAMTALACWSLLLQAWSGVPDGVLGMPFSGRVDDSVYEEVGLFTRLLPVRAAPAPEQPFLDHALALTDQVLTSLEFSDVPGQVVREAGASAGYRSVYAHQTDLTAAWANADGPARLILRDDEDAKYDLALACVEAPDRIRLRVDYDTAVYRHDTVAALLDQLVALVASAVADPTRTCRQLLTGLADPPPESPASDRPWIALPDQVRAHAERAPEAVAVRHGDRELTYRRLVDGADRVACWLADRGVGRGDIVALALRPGIGTIIAMLGVATSGAAYLPLDPEYPDAQLAAILDDAAPRLVLVEPDQTERPLTGVAVFGVDAALAATAGAPPAVTIGPHDTLNVLYTSGSTGRPKGVVLPHGGLARLMNRPDFIPLDATDVVSHLSPLNFDGASYEIWGALAHGAQLVVLDKTLVLSPTELRDELRRRGVTTMLVTTPLLNRLIEDAPETLQSLRRVYFGGELISVPHIVRALRWCGPGVLLHSYGPTENSFTATWLPIEQVDPAARTVPIGRPVPGTRAVVVFEGSLDPAPVGVPGELLLGGDGVALGYLNSPDRTAAAFVADPAGDGMLYRTGDRVRWLPDGLLEFVGRRDNQVKIRSQRVELGEVEAALRAHPAIASTFVTTVATPRGDKEIAAYLVPAAAVDQAELRAHLRSRLPSFAVPTHLVLLDALPLNDNGKVDRARLPDLTAAPAPRPTVLAGPAAAVHDAWHEVLGGAPIGVDDNFFDVGGHSLLLVRLQEALRRRGATFSIADLLRHTTISAQAAAMGGAAPAAASVPVRRAVADEPIAIVGMACRFAGAPDVYAYWANLLAGRACFTPDGEPVVTELDGGRRRIRRYGLLAEPNAFDAALCGFLPDEVAAIDPQHGILYECLWGAVTDAGLRMEDIPYTSVYTGRARRDWNPAKHDGFRRVDEVVGSDATFLASRFSYWHNLRGEAVMVDSACSTALLAVHLACQSLRHGGCELALAGGVAIADPPDGSYVYTPGQLFSADGYCRPFDRLASGTVPGDGAGAVLLRRLSDAERAGDPIYAVIRGSAANNEGRDKVGYTAPSVPGQAAVIGAALAAAGVDRTRVGYVETHGTGTRLGDTIEAIALTESFGARGVPLYVGSAKASIGHTDTAAGVAGLIKAALAVRHGQLPATPNVADPLPELGAGRFSLLPKTIPWPDTDGPRLAGVSSFGVGGTNVHLLLEQYQG